MCRSEDQFEWDLAEATVLILSHEGTIGRLMQERDEAQAEVARLRDALAAVNHAPSDIEIIRQANDALTAEVARLRGNEMGSK